MNCCVCRRIFSGYGNKPFPFSPPGDEHSRACDGCNTTLIIPTRLLCCSLKLTSPLDAHMFAQRYAHALRVRHYPRCGNLVDDLLKEYRQKASST